MKYGLIELHDLYDFKAPNAHREVVLCKDCRRYGSYECKWTRECDAPKADDFCSYGEREGE